MGYERINAQWGENRTVCGVLFDMDGLVLDSEVLYSRFWIEACREFGFEMSHAQSLKMRALGRTQAEAMLHSFFGTEADYHAIRAARIRLMDAYIEENGVQTKPGIFELMDYLQERGIRTAITSSSPVPRIRSHLSRHGLDTRFDALCSGRDMAHGKPAPDIYLHGAAVLGLKPEQCMALEDSPSGILSAYRAGCLPVMIPDQDQPDGETLERIYARCDTLADVIALIEMCNTHR